MAKTSLAKLWFLVISACALFAVPTSAYVSYNDTYGEFSTGIARVVNVFCFFTIITNSICAFLSFIYVKRNGKLSQNQITYFFSAVVSIIVVGVVYYLLVAPTQNLSGISIYTSFIEHTIVPIMFTIGWLIFVPHGVTTTRTVLLALIYPVGWAIFAMIRGSIVSYYPYSFMDVIYLGYAKALMNMAGVTAFFLLLFFGAHLLDKKLGKH
ncbi:MAG: Pr6Pr family membrane protein [Acidimicrobiia bacterium]